ncbi:MAG: hypothetical protein ABEH40_00520 [Haloferacaceae archaeon]
MNRAQYTVAAFMMFVRDTAMEADIPRRKRIEIDAAIKNMGLDPSELSSEAKDQSFQDLADLRIIHNDGERWYISPEIAEWLRIPEEPAGTAE